jgi:hypothetical protein
VPEEDDHQITCATYTHARRHPIVIGRIGGWTPPFQLTMAQLAVLLISYLLELWSWRYWIGLLPPLFSAFVAITIPAILSWAVRSTRLEGRSIARAGLGWITFLARSRHGRVGSRPYKPSPAVSLRGACVLVAAAPPEIPS